MLFPEYYEGCVDDILKLYEQLENDVISDIIRRMMKTGIVTESAKHQAEVLQNAGLLYDDILRIIARNTDAAQNQVKALFEDAGVETVHFDSEIYRENGEIPVDMRQSPAMRQTLEAGYRKTLGNMKNLTMTTAIATQTGFINACNQAYMQVASGAFSYQEAIKTAIKKTAENGAMVLYPSGYQERIDVAVRRAVLTGVGQTCKKIGEMNAGESECDIMEITAHSGARPDHAKWQEQLVSLSGRNAGRVIEGKKVLSLRQIDYGKGDGFGGWNCRHDWFPFFEGYSKPVYSDDDLKRLDEKNIEYNGKKYSKYEISQIQRRYEREIRSAKREQTAFKTAVQEAKDPELKQVMQDSLNYANDTVKRKQAKMRDFINQTGQGRDYFREQNYGTKKSEISENSFKLINFETGEVFNSKNFENQFKNEIEAIPKHLTEKVEKHIDNIFIRKGTSGYSKKKKIIFLDTKPQKGDIIHEIGHAIEDMLDIRNLSKYKKILRKGLENYTNYDIIEERQKYEKPFFYVKNDKFVTQYQGRLYIEDLINDIEWDDDLDTSPDIMREYFAEGFKYYILYSDTLKEKDIDLYNFIKEICENE